MWEHSWKRYADGSVLVARDAYGSRLLLMAPFSYDGGAPDHWYAWDIDLCWIAAVVGAGVVASAEDALREWRDAAGPAASGAALSPCTAGMTARLLAPCLQTGVLADVLQGRHHPWRVGPRENPDERSFYACSPHRIEMAAHLIREGYFAGYANPALRLLPEWTEWCIEQSGLKGDAAARSSKAARSAASVLVDDEDDESASEDDEAPFRRPE